ncbi:MAG TPA: DUF364 domain-containing protein [Gammaproteobacteria bacterium]|nr:DUF364 domain-containing protein [Gammaproteobacteria bacterium]
MNRNPQAVYDMILDRIPGDVVIERLCLGLTWTWCRAANGIGFAQSPGTVTRTLDFPGSVAGSRASGVAAWLRSWNPFAATVGLAAANAVINAAGNGLLGQVALIDGSAPANLAVFEHFRPCLERSKVVVVGRYPGLDSVLQGLDVTVLERRPGERDLPDLAADYVIPQADWVFLTATSLINKSFPRLAELAAGAVTVLMGPSAPWLAEFADFGIDYLAGVVPVDIECAATIAAEGGGTRLFGAGVRYAVADIGTGALAKLEQDIAETAARRVALYQAMEAWYTGGNRQRFPGQAELDAVTGSLSGLDTRYKRQWDARNTRCQ